MRLIDADALMESIGCADAVKYGNRDRAQQDISYRTMMLYEIRDEIDAQPTVGGWISVKDRLPEAAGYECLVCAANENTNQTHVFTAHTGYGEPGWWTSNAHYMSKAKSPSDNSLHPALRVTHWMPLPEPPEEVSGT